MNINLNNLTSEIFNKTKPLYPKYERISYLLPIVENLNKTAIAYKNGHILEDINQWQQIDKKFYKSHIEGTVGDYLADTVMSLTYYCHLFYYPIKIPDINLYQKDLFFIDNITDFPNDSFQKCIWYLIRMVTRIGEISTQHPCYYFFIQCCSNAIFKVSSLYHIDIEKYIFIKYQIQTKVKHIKIKT